MSDPGYGPLCGELERTYRLLAEVSLELTQAGDEAQRADAARRLEAVRERIKRCEGRLLVVSLGQKAPCDLGSNC
ncbi:protein of unknown function [Magnetospirillum sp. XM-1]|uniref:hypothetical protein n=1 Tax=Magnetospirillum sp. XM-1 TaxID=1663591 RepID=UPI00073DD933|nr:hypothetical protein [Magnetospirillum sp. XM-1]CUW40974.1 protein of unknown function [Magnetospirillum sp. XM-1]